MICNKKGRGIDGDSVGINGAGGRYPGRIYLFGTHLHAQLFNPCIRRKGRGVAILSCATSASLILHHAVACITDST